MAGDPASRATVRAGTPGDAGLPRSIFVPTEDPRKEARAAVDSILSDGFMAFLSVLLVPIILLPLLLTLPGWVASLLDVGDVTIILFFVAEYAAKIYLAADRRAYFRSPWHLLDLTVILLSFVSYLPFLALSGRGSAILLVRLLRLPRVLAVSGRTAGSRLGQPSGPPAPPAPPPEPAILVVTPDHPREPRPLAWAELEAHLADDRPEWIHIANLNETAALHLAQLLALPVQKFRLHQLDNSYPHVGRSEKAMFLFLQTGEIRYPTRPHEFFTITRRGAMIVQRGPKILSASPHGIDMGRIEALLPPPGATGPAFTLAVLGGVLEANVRDYRELLQEIGTEVAEISATPRSKLPKDFLSRAYQLNKATLRLGSSLFHLRELLGRLASGRVRIDGADERFKEGLEALSDETTFLSDVAKDASEALGTVTEVYVNESSFETNRILKILAVITAIAIIPATIGGLLGIDGPYDFILWQVVLFATIGMLFSLYCFIKLGWLRG